MVFFQNLMLYYLLIYATHNYDHLQTYPVYIHFVNHSLNQVPEFLSGRKEIGIVLQKQFEQLTIDKRYINVGLYFDGVLNFLKIDLTTVYLVEIENMGRIKFEPRLKYYGSYIKEVQHVNDLEYLTQISNIEQLVHKYGGETAYATMSKVRSQEIVTKIIDVSDVLGSSDDNNDVPV